LEETSVYRYREQLPDIADAIIDSCNDEACYTHVNYEPIPSKEVVIDVIDDLRRILFPGYYSQQRLDPVNLRYHMGQLVSSVFDTLSEQITRSIRHDCFRYDMTCQECTDRGYQETLAFMGQIPRLRNRLAADVEAAFDGDPAAKSHDEIIYSYPGLFAIMVYRVAHLLHNAAIPLLPRIMTEHAHSLTGIDIHPGAQIGSRFVIDHGTGVVIGETTHIGNNVRIYQGVTLGALSLPRGTVDRLRGQKRHPTIEDDVIIYSGATILGGETTIGARSVIGGNVWVTKSVPADTKVLLKPPRLEYK
jgi:serine O-acetyltransferase